MRTPLIALLLLFASQLFSQTHGVGPDWGPEVALPLADTSASQRGVLFNNMAVSSSGRIFISTEEINAVTGNFLGHYLTWSDDGLNWAAPVPIAGMEKVIGASGPKLAMDPDDNLYVLFEAKAPAGLFMTKYSSDLSILIDTVRVGHKVVHNSWATHLTCDAQGTLHAVWHEGDPNSGKTSEVYYSQSTDGGQSWSPQVMLSDDDGRSSAFPRVQMEAANGDLVAIAWRDSISPIFRWNVLMAVSEDGGQTWSAPFPVVASPDMNSDPDVVIDDQNRIHLFFH
ncbi:MAG: exo-alpha-sialidase, partial [Bacteroidetes bacterium]